MGIEFLLKKMQPRIELMMKQELLNILWLQTFSISFLKKLLNYVKIIP